MLQNKSSDLKILGDNSWKILHQKFSEYGRNAKEWSRTPRDTSP